MFFSTERHLTADFSVWHYLFDVDSEISLDRFSEMSLDLALLGEDSEISLDRDWGEILLDWILDFLGDFAGDFEPFLLPVLRLGLFFSTLDFHFSIDRKNFKFNDYFDSWD